MVSASVPGVMHSMQYNISSSSCLPWVWDMCFWRAFSVWYAFTHLSFVSESTKVQGNGLTSRCWLLICASKAVCFLKESWHGGKAVQ